MISFSYNFLSSRAEQLVLKYVCLTATTEFSDILSYLIHKPNFDRFDITSKIFKRINVCLCNVIHVSKT